jgi:hypothetical protein
MHIEGADLEFFGAGQGRKIQHMPCATQKGYIVFVEMDKVSVDGAGQLSSIHESRPHLTYKRITEASAEWAYLYPSPVADNRILVSKRPADFSSSCMVVQFDLDKQQADPVFGNPEFENLQAKVLRPSISPDGHSTVVNTKTNVAAFYGLNCYLTDAKMKGHLPQGTVKRVRLIEGMPLQAESGSAVSRPNGVYVPRRLLGEAYVESDGSFNIEVPPSIPLLLQTLDARGMALTTCGWIWLQPRENRGCIGCHEDPERIPENEYVQALRRPPNKLLLSPTQRRMVTFKKDVMPILSAHCASANCHGKPQLGFRLPANTTTPSEEEMAQTYRSLLSQTDETTDAGSKNRQYVDVGRARTSFLVWSLFGTNTSRPWDTSLITEAQKSRKVHMMPPPSRGKPLSEDELKTIIEWIDMGAEYSDTSTMASGTTTQP